jgi:transposase-like protein
MVLVVRQGASIREVARRYCCGVATVHLWVRRAGDRPLGEINWNDRPSLPHKIQRTDRTIEDLVLTLRRELRETSVLGEYGAAAIHAELLSRGISPVPSVRTIGRMVQRRGALDNRRRMRQRPPVAGWYLPDVAEGASELDSFDVIEDLMIEGGIHVDVFTAISLHGGLVACWPDRNIPSTKVVSAMSEHWCSFGLPTYAQFDNDARFQGNHRFADSIGRVIRLCLSLGVTPVFAPPRETGFQAAIESFNGRWQAKVWQRFHYESLAALQLQSARYTTAYRSHGTGRIEQAPERRSFPSVWQLDLQAHPRGRIVYLRRTSELGKVNLLGHSFFVDQNWPHRLVRAEVNLNAGVISFYALRRREPAQQPLLRTVEYRFPNRRFSDRSTNQRDIQSS